MMTPRQPSFLTRHSARGASRRRGAVLLEMALILMILLLLCFGIMEYGHFVYTRHTLESAAQRGARVAILSSATMTEIESAISSVMSAAGYGPDEYTATVTGLNNSATTDVTVEVEVTWGQVGIRPFGLISADKAFAATVIMRKEG